MKVEPLCLLLKNKNLNQKHNIIIDILDNDNTLKLKNYKLQDNLYLDDNIICICKDSLDIYKKGKIINIDKNKLFININYKYNLRINKDKYYIFVKNVNKKNKDRYFYESLLKIL